MLRTNLCVVLIASVAVAGAGAQQPTTPATNATGGAQQSTTPATNTSGGIRSQGIGVDARLYYKSELLKNPEIHEEIELTDAQKDQLKKLEEQRLREVKRIYSEIQNTKQVLKENADLESQQAFRQSALALARTLTREDEKPLLKVLNREQRNRLEQIQLRADGYMAFTLPEIPERLGMDPEQVQEIAAIVSQGRRIVRSAALTVDSTLPDLTRMTAQERRAFEDSEKFQASAKKTRKATMEARQSTMEAIGKVLTRAQKAKYQIMLGKEFDFGRLKGSPAAATVDSKAQTKDQ